VNSIILTSSSVILSVINDVKFISNPSY
jgi:hypothetical protein